MCRSVTQILKLNYGTGFSESLSGVKGSFAPAVALPPGGGAALGGQAVWGEATVSPALGHWGLRFGAHWLLETPFWVEERGG